MFKRFAHLVRTRTVTDKNVNNGIIGIAAMDINRNPKYGSLDYDDPRRDETFEQKFILHQDLYLDFDKRIRALEAQRNSI